MRHRKSRRQWKRRCEAGYEIPLTAIVDYSLRRWFNFVELGKDMRHFYYAERK